MHVNQRKYVYLHLHKLNLVFLIPGSSTDSLSSSWRALFYRKSRLTKPRIRQPISISSLSRFNNLYLVVTHRRGIQTLQALSCLLFSFAVNSNANFCETYFQCRWKFWKKKNRSKRWNKNNGGKKLTEPGKRVPGMFWIEWCVTLKLLCAFQGTARSGSPAGEAWTRERGQDGKREAGEAKGHRAGSSQALRRVPQAGTTKG